MSQASTRADKLAIFGGEPVHSGKWPTWPVWDETEQRELLEVLTSGNWWWGAKVKQFEEAFSSFQDARYGVTTTSGTTALEMALKGIGVLPEDEVIVPAYSFIATASTVLNVGATPVFADIQPDTLCLDPDDVERKITPRTKVIIPVHVAGFIADMDRLRAIAIRHDLVILEDACHAWGSKWMGKGAGSLGNAGVFSFQQSKNITSGEGGILLTDDEALADTCRSYAHIGRRKGSAWYDHDFLGSNLRLTEFQAALLLAQLTRLAEQTQQREANARLLNQELTEISEIRTLRDDSRITCRSYHMYIFRLDIQLLGPIRDRFVEALTAEGIPATAGWFKPLYSNGVFQNKRASQPHPIKAPLVGKEVQYAEVCCPVTEEVCRDTVWIPQRVLLAEEGIELVARAVEKVAAHSRELI